MRQALSRVQAQCHVTTRERSGLEGFALPDVRVARELQAHKVVVFIAVCIDVEGGVRGSESALAKECLDRYAVPVT